MNPSSLKRLDCRFLPPVFFLFEIFGTLNLREDGFTIGAFFVVVVVVVVVVVLVVVVVVVVVVVLNLAGLQWSLNP